MTTIDLTRLFETIAHLNFVLNLKLLALISTKSRKTPLGKKVLLNSDQVDCMLESGWYPSTLNGIQGLQMFRQIEKGRLDQEYKNKYI